MCLVLLRFPSLPRTPSSDTHSEMYILALEPPVLSEMSCESDNCFDFLIVETHMKVLGDCTARCETESWHNLHLICGRRRMSRAIEMQR